jgi:TrmH RNA methyltransferase
MSRVNRFKKHSAKTEKQRGGSASRDRFKKVIREDLVKFYGVNQCKAIFRNRRNQIRRVFIDEVQADVFQDLIEWSDRRGIPCKVVSRDELSKVAATEHHEGVCCEALPIELVPVSKFISKLKDESSSQVLILEDVENPHNVGAILRTAGFFGVSAILLISKQLRALSGATCRVSEGAAEVLPITIARDGDEVFSALKASGYTVFATTPHQASSIYSVRWPKKVALIFGAEGSGLSEKSMQLAEQRIAIPREGAIESLNVGVAVGCVLAELARPQQPPRQSTRARD